MDQIALHLSTAVCYVLVVTVILILQVRNFTNLINLLKYTGKPSTNYNFKNPDFDIIQSVYFSQSWRFYTFTILQQ